jgi:coenzyme F420-0:L-glutamate ligase / coenzyme F420-1:gamma-L-glutamate ligase
MLRDIASGTNDRWLCSPCRCIEASGRRQAARSKGTMSVMTLSVFPLAGLPMIRPGDDLPSLLRAAIDRAGLAIAAGDVVVVAQKIVSKSEGRDVALADVGVDAEAGELAARTGKEPRMAALILAEAAEVVRATPQVVIARHRSGHVLANAGIDQSNIGDDERALLWPQDCDASARAIRDGLGAASGIAPAVIVSDSLGRAWRMGTTGSAIGVAGIKPVRDRRGETDLFGRILQSTIIGVADEIAAAASLVMGEGDEGIPAALVRGAVYDADDAAQITDLLRPVAQDLFR